MISNQGKLLIVAGASKGIGYSITEQMLIDYPDYSILAISRNPDPLTNLQKQYSNLFIESADLSCLSNENKSNIISIVKRFNLEGIIFTAGILELKNIGEITKTLFTEIYINNVWSFIDLTQTVFNFINDRTHIVSIGSMGGHTGTLKFSGMSIYSSSKSALSSFTECLSEEIKSKGASANCLMIGAVETEMKNKAFPDFYSEITANDMADFIIRFTLYDKKLFNGKVIPVSCTIP
jgi:3-oxoacyl-[acyl-carrier protein] reductase